MLEVGADRSNCLHRPGAVPARFPGDDLDLCAGLLAAGGLLAALTIRDPRTLLAPARAGMPVCVSLAGNPVACQNLPQV